MHVVSVVHGRLARLFTNAAKREQRLLAEGQRLAEFAALVGGEQITTEVLSDQPFVDAVLDVAERIGADLIVKLSRFDEQFTLGLFANHDWQLLRESTVPTLFLKHEGPPLGGPVIAAVKLEDDSDDTDAVVMESAGAWADATGAQRVAVHVYDVPTLPVPAVATLDATAGVNAVAGEAALEAQRAAAASARERHAARATGFVRQHGLDPDDLLLGEGPLWDALPHAARELGASLVVLGSEPVGILERFTGHAAAEHTLAELPCHALFVKA